MKQTTLKQKIDYIILELIKQGYTKKDYSETTPIKLGLSQSDFTKISYITEKRQNQLIQNNVVKSKQFTKEQRKKYFYHTSPAKLLKKFVDIDASNCDDLQPYADKLSEYIIEQKKIDLKAFEGSEIADIYNMSEHRFGEKSCMQQKHKSYFEIYEHLPVKLYAIIENGELLARCLVWHKIYDNKDKKIYIDRIYSFGYDALTKIIYRKMIYKILKIEKPQSEIIHAFNCRHLQFDGVQFRSSPPFSFVTIENGMEIDDYDALPYMDTFQYSCGEHLEIDKNGDTRYHLNCTGGTYEEIEHIYCDCCGASIDEDYQVYCEDVDETRCDDCSQWSEIDDCYYAEENAVYIAGNVNSFVHNDDIQE